MNRKPPSLLFSFTRSTLGKELINFALCAQVIRLYSGGLMTENMNSGGFLILHGTFIVQYNKVHYIVVHCSLIVTSQST